MKRALIIPLFLLSAGIVFSGSAQVPRSTSPAAGSTSPRSGSQQSDRQDNRQNQPDQQPAARPAQNDRQNAQPDDQPGNQPAQSDQQGRQQTQEQHRSPGTSITRVPDSRAPGSNHAPAPAPKPTPWSKPAPAHTPKPTPMPAPAPAPVYAAPAPVSADRIAVSSRTLGVLEYADGWMLEPDGNWYSRPNRIPAYFINVPSIRQIDDPYYFKGHDNFLSYEFREVDYRGPDGRSCVVMIQRKVNTYRYGTSLNKWDNYTKTIKYYVFTRSEFNKLSSAVMNNTLNIVEVDLLYIGTMEGLSSDYGYIDMVERDLYRACRYGLRISSVYAKELLFMILPDTAAGTVRFNIVEASYDILSPHSYDVKYRNAVPGRRIKDFTPWLRVNNVSVKDPVFLFDNCHYETGFNEFSRFIPLPVPAQRHSPSGNFSPLGW